MGVSSKLLSDVIINSDIKEKELLNSTNKRFVYQKYYGHCDDLRLYVLNKKSVGAVIRHNAKDFRSNYSLGGDVQSYQPEKELVETATKVAKLLNADYIGVDFIKVNNIWLINEIEDPVGARMLYQTSDIDIIQLYLEYILKTI